VAKKAPNPDAPYITPAGWYRPRVNWRAQFEKFQGKPPEEGDKFQITKLVKYTRGGIAAGNEATFETGHQMLGFYVRTGKFPGKKSRDKLAAKGMATTQAHVNAYHASHSSFFSKLNPVKLISAAANVVTKALPFVKTALSLVPGIGTGINMALSAAESLAKGRPLTDAFLDAAKSALPGGPVAQSAFTAAVSLAKGQRIDEALLSAAKSNLPPEAQKAFDVGVAIAHGRNIQDAVISEVKNLAADQIKGLKLPIPPGIEVPAGMQHGFQVGLGVLNNAKLPSGIPLTPAAALAIRKRLPIAQRIGFDRAMAMRALKNYRAGSPHVPRPKHRSLEADQPTVMITEAGLVQI
jgi:hypothetical protein